MSFKIAIASGKGGTGKTTVSVSLFNSLQEKYKLQLVDCDVEEPNDAIFFPSLIKEREVEIMQQIPVIDTDKCTFCRKCVGYCEFNAIVVIPPVNFAEVNANLCHSCGGCTLACKHNAIIEKPESIGRVNFFKTPNGTQVTEGRLKIGSAMQTMLIKELKKHVTENPDITLYDAPPGTSCPVVETVSDVDLILLVAEPTPFGLHDLKLMVTLLKEIDKPFALVINKAGLGNNEIYTYIEEENISLLGEIPFSKEYASSYAQGNIAQQMPAEITNAYHQLINNLVLNYLNVAV